LKKYLGNRYSDESLIDEKSRKSWASIPKKKGENIMENLSKQELMDLLEDTQDSLRESNEKIQELILEKEDLIDSIYSILEEF